MKRHAKVFLVTALTMLWTGCMVVSQSNEEADLQSTFEQKGLAGDPKYPFRRGDLWGFLDRDGRVAISPQYRHTTGVQDGLALVWSEAGLCVINATGKIVGRLPDSCFAWWAAENRIWLLDKESRLYSLFDANGNQIVPPTFQEVRTFRGGFAVVATGGVWEFPGFLEDATYSYIDLL